MKGRKAEGHVCLSVAVSTQDRIDAFRVDPNERISYDALLRRILDRASLGAALAEATLTEQEVPGVEA